MPAFSAWSVGVTHAVPMLASSARCNPMLCPCPRLVLGVTHAVPMLASSARRNPMLCPGPRLVLGVTHAVPMLASSARRNPMLCRFSVFGMTPCRFQWVSKAAFVVVVVCFSFPIIYADLRGTALAPLISESLGGPVPIGPQEETSDCWWAAIRMRDCTAAGSLG